MTMDPNLSPAAGRPVPERRSWWSRNWIWFVPTGCLTFLALIVGFVAVLVLVVAGSMKSSDAYKEAVERAKNNPAVIEALGTPIEEGWFVSGKTNVTGPSGEADLAIPISGPKGSATIYVVAEKSAGEWNFSTLRVEVKGSDERIDLQAALPAE